MKVTCKDFLNGINLNKLNKEYSKGENSIFIESTSFKLIDSVYSGRNRTSRLSQLNTELLEVGSLFFLSGKYSPDLYAYCPIKKSHGFGNDTKILIVFKDSKNKKHSVTIDKPWDLKDFELPYKILDLFKNEVPTKRNKTWDTRIEWQNRLETFIKNQLYFNYNILERGYLPEVLDRLIKNKNIKILKIFPFTHCFCLSSMEYVKQNKLNIEMGFYKNGTYNSLPSTLKIISRKKPLETLSLEEMGIENRGYTEWRSDKFLIQKKDEKKVKTFFSSFKKNVKNS